MRRRFRSRRFAARWREPPMGVAPARGAQSAGSAAAGEEAGSIAPSGAGRTAAVGGSGWDPDANARASTLGRNTVTSFRRGQGVDAGGVNIANDDPRVNRFFAENSSGQDSIDQRIDQTIRAARKSARRSVRKSVRKI